MGAKCKRRIAKVGKECSEPGYYLLVVGELHRHSGIIILGEQHDELANGVAHVKALISNLLFLVPPDGERLPHEPAGTASTQGLK